MSADWAQYDDNYPAQGDRRMIVADYYDGPHEPTRAQALDERVHLRPQHNPQDPACRVASIFADGKGWNRCHICHPKEAA